MMTPLDGEGCVAIGNDQSGYLVYVCADHFSLPIVPSKYIIHTVDAKSGKITMTSKASVLENTFERSDVKPHTILWLRKK